MQKQTKWLLGAVAALILINLALVASIWLKKEEIKRPPSGDAKEFLIKSLNLNEAQVKAFDELRTGHFERMRTYRENMRRLKDKLFGQLNWPRNAQADSLAKKIGDLQAKIDLETFEHFARLRELLNEKQAEKFDETIQDVLRTMGPKGPGQGRREQGGPPGGERPEGPPRPDGPPQ